MAHIIRQYNSPKEFTLPNGKKVRAKREIYVPEFRNFIKTAPYDNAAIYETGETKKGTLPYMCTCGSVAVVVNYDAYKNDASPQGALFVCLIHAQTGHHANGID